MPHLGTKVVYSKEDSPRLIGVWTPDRFTSFSSTEDEVDQLWQFQFADVNLKLSSTYLGITAEKAQKKDYDPDELFDSSLNLLYCELVSFLHKRLSRAFTLQPETISDYLREDISAHDTANVLLDEKSHYYIDATMLVEPFRGKYANSIQRQQVMNRIVCDLYKMLGSQFYIEAVFDEMSPASIRKKLCFDSSIALTVDCPSVRNPLSTGDTVVLKFEADQFTPKSDFEALYNSCAALFGDNASYLQVQGDMAYTTARSRVGFSIDLTNLVSEQVLALEDTIQIMYPIVNPHVRN